jgi:hypothetical protein
MRIPHPHPAIRRASLVAVALSLLAGCARPPHPADWADVRELTPASLERRTAEFPALATDGGARVALTFVQPDSAGGRTLWLAVSRDSGRTFAAPVRVDTAAHRVSSYAESRPMAAWGPDGRLAVVWSELRSDTALVAALMVRTSADGGRTFAAPVTVNDDSLGAPVFHGFPALAWLADGTLFAAWMDGRTHPLDESESYGALFTSRSADDGHTWDANTIVTDSLCPCCRATVADLGDGRLALAYRSAARGVRDPVIAFSADGGRTFGPEHPLAADHWVLDACPSQGPSLAVTGVTGVAVWTTGAEPAGTYFAPWAFGAGPTGPRRALLDSLARGEHPKAAPLGAATLLAVAGVPRGDSVWVAAVRALEPDGTLTPWVFLGVHARDVWLAPVGRDAALVAWVERHAGAARVRLARVTHRVRPER